jgi:PAP2 superfamily
MNTFKLGKFIIIGTFGWLTTALAMQETDSDVPSSEDRVAQQVEEKALRRIPPAFSDNAVIVAWSEKAYDIAFAEDQFLTFKGHRAFAMMHIAMHDALNAIVPVYRQYLPVRRHGFAHPIIAAAQAAHDVLASQYPKEQIALTAELNRWLARVPEGRRKSKGIALGHMAAAAILAARVNDGWDFQGNYAFESQPGKYRTTPPWNGFVFQPGFRFAQPFALKTPDQFRPAQPPLLESTEYAADNNEVKDFGALNSKLRTPDQTGHAIWWMEFSEGSVIRLARNLVDARRTHLWRAARLFALLNMSLFDGYIATWDAKYHYNTWRPYSAIHEASDDGNPLTQPDANWEALSQTPPFPEYVSAHSAGCNSSFEILRCTFGDNVSFTMKTTTAPPDMPTRSFTSFSAAGAECADSRVMNGFHFRYATQAGIVLGREVARYINTHQLQPRAQRH